jgi:hypothetical protein
MVKAIEIEPLNKDELTKKDDVAKLKVKCENLLNRSGLKGRRLLTPAEKEIVQKNYDLVKDRLQALKDEETLGHAETGKKHGLLAQKHILKGLGHMKKSTTLFGKIAGNIKSDQELNWIASMME